MRLNRPKEVFTLILSLLIITVCSLFFQKLQFYVLDVEWPNRNLHKFCIFRVTGSKCPIWPCFLEVQQKDLRSFVFGNYSATKGICAHLGLWIGYLPSNTRI